MSTRAQRRARRRATWDGEIVLPGHPKGPLYKKLALPDRFAALTALNQRIWGTVGLDRADRLARGQWPGEVFEIKESA